MPLVQKQLSDYFSNAEILNSLSPDEVIAVGASKQVKYVFSNAISWLVAAIQLCEIPARLISNFAFV